MLDPDLLKLLICPESAQPLAIADDQIIADLNLDIQQRKIRNAGGNTLTRPLDGGLIREDRQVLYPIVDGIPAMLNDEAIKLENSNA
ncbi:MAG: Trm112 family protein [Planctomycetota bacterium]|nr:Trm112 family protein [Planctomycetota bacterium]